LSYFLYSVVLATAMLVSLPWWLFQILRHGKYRTGFAERIGRVPARLREPSDASVIWVHAVSVGEVLAVSGLVEAMRRNFPQRRVLVSTTTDTGQQLARKRFGEANVFYFPLDFAFAIRPYLQALRPELVVLAETEFWPNFLRLVHASGARIAVVNGRISDRSLPNYRRFQWALRRMLAHVDMFLTQTDEDAERLRSIGAEPARIRVTGNLKFDVAVPTPAPIVETLRRSLTSDGAGPVLVCGSTVEGEEEILLEAFETVRSVHPRAVMILAPRHPERFEEVAALLDQSGVPFKRRTQWSGETLAGGVLLVDSIGELSSLYALADVAFVGGSLVPRGGHNIIEPALHGAAIVVGKHTENFRDIVALFRSRDAVRVVSPSEFTPVLIQLLADDSKRGALGRRAAETVRSQTGATERTLAALQTLLVQRDQNSRAAMQAAHTE
jgi:3-deoxy-D-manno-octulosonic-acid transferase